MDSHRLSGRTARQRAKVGRRTLCVLASAAVTVAQAGGARLHSDLENKRFVGPLGIEGEAHPPNDMLTFSDGRFTSEICRQYGFRPASYWVRQDDAGVRFRTELHSPDNGTIRFDGVYDGEELHATAVWTKERWYWTVEQKFVFTGGAVR